MSQTAKTTATKTRPEFSAEPAVRVGAAREPGEEPSEEPGERTATVRLAGFLRLLWEQRSPVGRTTLAGLALGTMLAFVLPKQYQSTAQLMPPDSHSATSGMLAALSARAGSEMGPLAGDLLGNNSTGALFIGILRSRTLEDRLVERFHLKKVYGVTLGEDARTRLANNTGVSEDHKSGILSLSVVDHDPVRAEALAGAYVEELDRLVSELSTSSARRERKFLEQRLVVVKQELDRASEEFSQFSSRNTAINIPEQGKAMVVAAATLQGQWIAAESELKGLSEIYTANNVRVRAAAARASELRRQLDMLDGNKLDGNKLDGKKLDGNSGSAVPVDSARERPAFPSIRELPLLGVTYAELLRQTKIQEAVYETLTQQFELAKVEEAKETPSVKVLDASSRPERKVFPPRLLIISWGTLVGFAAGVLGAVGSRRWRQMDSRHPAKLLAGEVLRALRAALWAPPNGSPLHPFARRLWKRIARQLPKAEVSPESPPLEELQSR